MLSMAYLARALTAWVPQKRLLSYGVRFAAITQVADRVQCSGKVVEKLEYRGRPCARIELTASRNGEQVTLSGDAIVDTSFACSGAGCTNIPTCTVDTKFSGTQVDDVQLQRDVK